MTAPPTPAGMPEPMSDLRSASLDELEAVVTAYGRQCYEAGRAAARDAVLEDAAQVCDARYCHPEDDEAPLVWERAADAIRALKGIAPPAQGEQHG